MIIRAEQIAEFARVEFEQWMRGHLTEFFPEKVAALDKPELLRRIRMAFNRGRLHGFQTGPEMCRFIDLTFALGSRFDEDPELPWASEILNDPRLTTPEMRMDILFGAAQDYLYPPPPSMELL